MSQSKLYLQPLRRKLLTVLLVAVAAVPMMGMGEKYSEQGHALSKKVYELFLQQGYCKDQNDCYKKEYFFGEHGNRVNIHIYGVTDRKFISMIFSMALIEGPDISKGAPITINVYPKPKSEYMRGFKTFTKEPIYTLELNQQ